MASMHPTPRHVDVGVWQALKQEGAYAKSDWAELTGNPGSDFWLAGDAAFEGERADALREQGFDALTFGRATPTGLDIAVLDSTYTALSEARVSAPGSGFITLVGSGEMNVETAFLPGTLHLVDGASNPNDELAAAALNFRRRHVAVGAGLHRRLAESPYTVERTYRGGGVDDVVIAVFGAEGRTRVNVSSAFPDDAIVHDAVTG